MLSGRAGPVLGILLESLRLIPAGGLFRELCLWDLAMEAAMMVLAPCWVVWDYSG